MPLPYLGELIAFATVLCWAVGSQFIEASGKRIGVPAVNFFRLLIAFVLLSLTMLIVKGEIFPLGFPGHAWKWLLLSGLVGFTFGDMFLFKSYVEIGPRLTALVMSLNAPVTALIGWSMLDENYQPLQWVGMVITMCGVSWVLLKQNGNTRKSRHETKRLQRRTVSPRQLGYAFLGMFGQSIGYVMSKAGMTNGTTYLDPFASTQIRMIGGAMGFIVLFSVLGLWPKMVQATRNKPALGFTLIGAVLGSYLGVSLSMLALHYTSTGVAATILSLVPIVLIPLAIVIHKEHISIHGVLGAFVAFSGVVLLAGFS